MVPHILRSAQGKGGSSAAQLCPHQGPPLSQPPPQAPPPTPPSFFTLNNLRLPVSVGSQRFAVVQQHLCNAPSRHVGFTHSVKRSCTVPVERTHAPAQASQRQPPSYAGHHPQTCTMLALHKHMHSWIITTPTCSPVRTTLYTQKVTPQHCTSGHAPSAPASDGSHSARVGFIHTPYSKMTPLSVAHRHTQPQHLRCHTMLCCRVHHTCVVCMRLQAELPRQDPEHSQSVAPKYNAARAEK